MKKLAIIISALFITISLNGQSISDPSYSVNNYKHPNKAAYAKANFDQSTKLEYRKGRKLSNINYKQQNSMVAYSENNGAMAPVKKEEKNRNGWNSKRNYKRQF